MKSLETCLELDFYGRLLTDKMRETLELYYFDDLSLAEIADTENISRQGVHDTVKRAVKLLDEYEAKLGLVARFSVQKEAVDKAISLLKNDDMAGALEVLAELRNELTTD